MFIRRSYAQPGRDNAAHIAAAEAKRERKRKARLMHCVAPFRLKTDIVQIGPLSASTVVPPSFAQGYAQVAAEDETKRLEKNRRERERRAVRKAQADGQS